MAARLGERKGRGKRVVDTSETGLCSLFAKGRDLD